VQALLLSSKGRLEAISVGVDDDLFVVDADKIGHDFRQALDKGDYMDRFYRRRNEFGPTVVCDGTSTQVIGHLTPKILQRMSPTSRSRATRSSCSVRMLTFGASASNFESWSIRLRSQRQQAA